MSKANGRRHDRSGEPLSPREQEVVVARVNTGSDDAAAHALGICKSVLNYHLAHAREKTGARNTTHLAALTFPVLRDRFLETPTRRELGTLIAARRGVIAVPSAGSNP